MTSEELIVLIDSLQTRLPKCAVQVLLHLVAKCITAGTNEVDISARDLADELHLSRDAVKVAARALIGIVESSGSAGVPTSWTLPAEWFVVQRSLFAIASPSQDLAQWPSNQANMAWKPGQLMAEKPGHDGLETRPIGRVTRPSWTTYQAINGLETRPVSTENQQDEPKNGLVSRPLSIDRDRGLSSVERVVNLRDSIDTVDWLPEVCREEAAELKRWLRVFYARHHRSHTVPDGPDEIILAKCLAIASLQQLGRVLHQLNKKATKPGDGWAWFVTVFCQRIHRTRDLTIVASPPAFRQGKKTPSSEGAGEFQTDLLRETSAAVGRM